LEGATDNKALRQRFETAFMHLVHTGGGGRGPGFGQRKDEYLPYLVVRTHAGDRGARPLSGVPFWESPDIFVVPNLEAGAAPALPPSRGGQPVAFLPNTVWAHVWNLGRAPVYNARVEFFWHNLRVGALSVNPPTLIGVAYVDLGDRDSGHAHTIVKCPTTWMGPPDPFLREEGMVIFSDSGLLVRCHEPLTDPLGPAPWDPVLNRHVARCNLFRPASQQPGSSAGVQIPFSLGRSDLPGPATLAVSTAKPETVGRLALLGGAKGARMRDASSAKEIFGLMAPTPLRSPKDRPDLSRVTVESLRKLLRKRIDFQLRGDELEATFYARVEGVRQGECRVYRIQQTAGGRIIGGFTVVVGGH
jgi:hypothetical protein